MDCEAFDRRLDSGDADGTAVDHAGECPRCARRLALVRALRELPDLRTPESLDTRIREAMARSRRRAGALTLLRAAAAVLLLAAAGLTLLARGSGVEPRWPDLEVVKVPTSGLSEEELLIEQIYGPEIPVLEAGEAPIDGARHR